jgi:general secretion pathway protein K
MLVLAIVGVVGAEFSYSMRQEASAARAYKELILASHLAESAVEQAIREIVNPTSLYAAVDDKGVFRFFTRDRLPVPLLPREKVPLGDGQYTYRISDEESRIHLNSSNTGRLERLLLALDVDKRDRDVILDSLQDWRDSNEEHRLNGAESEFYLARPVPYRSRNGNLESVTELLQINGVTPALFRGAEGKPGLVDLVTVRGTGQVNINTAGPLVLKALGLSDAEISDIGQARRETPFPSVPGRFGGRGLSVTTRTFRIEAEGLVGGAVRARVTAVVQKSPTTSQVGPTTIIEWSGIR